MQIKPYSTFFRDMFEIQMSRYEITIHTNAMLLGFDKTIPKDLMNKYEKIIDDFQEFFVNDLKEGVDSQELQTALGYYIDNIHKYMYEIMKAVNIKGSINLSELIAQSFAEYLEPYYNLLYRLGAINAGIPEEN